MKNWHVFIGGDDYYNYGKIVYETADFILVKLNSTDGVPSNNKLYHLECLAHCEDVFFFETENELKNWLTWLETSEASKGQFKILNFDKNQKQT